MLFQFELIDVIIAMTMAGLVNMAMLILAAATFHAHGLSSIGTIQEAYKMFTPLLGGAASFVFAISLLASGHASSTVGTMAGQVIMQGFIHQKIPMWTRRLATMTAFLHCDRNAARSHPDIGLEPGSIELWSAICDHSIDFLYGQSWDNGRVGEP
jgi:NRAMP (natural resistance-associated macrophage protein)-like metal ion transporter